MRTTVKIGIVILALTGLLTQFTNCDVYSESAVFDASSAFDCSGNDCFAANADVLELTAQPEIYLFGTNALFDMGGFCNDAGFPDNRVTWTLSRAAGAPFTRTCSQVSACGQCVNGRYELRVSYPTGYQPATGDQIVLELVGLDGAGQPVVGRPTATRRTVNVVLRSL